MTKIDIISGFLGAGKTTLIKKLLAEAFPGEKLVLIENEFGEISIDGGFLKESGVQISEMSSGCICCSLVGDFNKALRDALPMLTGTFDVAHICGKGNLDPTLDKTPGYTQVEFLDQDLPDVLAAADLVLSRAGSNALMEFQALARPLLLVPYPKGASRGDQILNAQSLEKRGLCHVLLQENMTPQTLTDALMQTWAERDKLTAAVKNAPPADGTKRVLEMIEEVQTRKA